MNHCSKNDSILWYVDEITPRGESMYYIKGWIFHRKHQIKELKISENYFTDYQYHARPDVAEIYSECRFPDNTGFELLISSEQIDIPVSVIFGDGNYVTIESLRKFFIFHSGFNTGHKNLIVVDNFIKIQMLFEIMQLII
jgi:hypothetical protein